MLDWTYADLGDPHADVATTLLILDCFLPPEKSLWERLASRVTLRSATPRECLTLADSLLMAGELAEVMAPLQGPLLKLYSEHP